MSWEHMEKVKRLGNGSFGEVCASRHVLCARRTLSSVLQLWRVRLLTSHSVRAQVWSAKYQVKKRPMQLVAVKSLLAKHDTPIKKTEDETKAQRKIRLKTNKSAKEARIELLREAFGRCVICHAQPYCVLLCGQ